MQLNRQIPEIRPCHENFLIYILFVLSLQLTNLKVSYKIPLGYQPLDWGWIEKGPKGGSEDKNPLTHSKLWTSAFVAPKLHKGLMGF